MASVFKVLLIAGIVGAPWVARADRGDQKAQTEQKAQSEKSEKKEQRQKKGALKERVDPQKDAKLQKANVERLERNAEIERANGNRVGAWAAEGDAKHARKLLEKDKKALQSGERKQRVDDRNVRDVEK